MQKRGQVTLFIFIGVVLLLILALAFFLKPSQKAEIITPDILPVKMFAQECMKETAQNALLLVGVQGGNIYFQDVKYIDTFYSGVRYWYYQGENLTPSKSTVEAQLNKYVNEELGRCIRNFSSFREDLQTGAVETHSMIGDKGVLFDITYPITMSKGGSISRISQFSFMLPVRLGAMMDTAGDIVSMEMRGQGIDLGYLADLGMETAIYQYTDHVVIYSINDDNSTLFNEPYKLVFANRLVESQVPSNSPPQFVAISDIIALEDEQAVYQFDAFDQDNDTLTYSTANPYFTIDNQGVIDFTPDEEDVGEHEIIVEVSDSKGGSDRKLIGVYIIGVNDNAPEFSVRNQIAAVGIDFAYKIDATDKDGDNLTYTLTAAPQGMIISNDGLITWKPAEAKDEVVGIEVSDGYFVSSVEFTVYVVKDEAPVISPIGPREVNAGEEFVFNVAATDPDGDPLLYYDDTDLFDIGMYNGEIRFVPDTIGTYNIQITASDSVLNSSETMVLDVK